MAPDDDDSDLPSGPPPPRTDRPWRHPSELGDRPTAIRAASHPAPARPGLWVLLTASAVVGTVAVVVVVALARQMPAGEVAGSDTTGSADGATNTLLQAPEVEGGRAVGPTIPHHDDDQPWLGIEGRDADGAVLVTRVVAAGPAATAGLRVGDMIVAAQREAVASMAQLQALVGGLEPGAVFVLDVLRDQARMRLMAVLGVRA